MPREVDQFVPWRALMFVADRLRLIQRANGYNCDAGVYTELEPYRNSSERFAVLVYSDGGGPDEQELGGGDGGPRVQERIAFVINASVKYDTENPQRTLMALEQDVRTAIHTGVDQVRTYTGTGMILRWGEVQRFVTALSAERESGFSLTCSLAYKQGSTW